MKKTLVKLKERNLSTLATRETRGLKMSEHKTLKLCVELVPSTVWESSLYRLVPREVWNRIRDNFITENGRKCQICGEVEGTMNLHEIWKYDDKNHTQKLEGLILLCKMCHNVKHIGLSGKLASQGKLDYDAVIDHFCKVNDCSERDFQKHLRDSFETWHERSTHIWKQDFGKYKEFIVPKLHLQSEQRFKNE